MNSFTTENTREQVAALLNQARTAVLDQTGDYTAAFRLMTKATTLMDRLRNATDDRQMTRLTHYPTA